MEHEKSSKLIENYTREFDVFDFLRYILRKWKMIVITAGAGFLLAVMYVTLIATPLYEATAQLYVMNSRNSVLNLSDLQIGTYLASDYQLVFNTWEVNQQVIDNLDLPYSVRELKSMLTVTNPGNTRALFITVVSSNAQEAAAIANEYANVASKYISTTMLTDTPSLLSEALAPSEPVKPQKMLIVCGATILGIFLAIWILLICYMRDDKIKTSTDIVKYTGTLPLAVIPITNNSKNNRKRA